MVTMDKSSFAFTDEKRERERERIRRWRMGDLIQGKGDECSK